MDSKTFECESTTSVFPAGGLWHYSIATYVNGMHRVYKSPFVEGLDSKAEATASADAKRQTLWNEYVEEYKNTVA